MKHIVLPWFRLFTLVVLAAAGSARAQDVRITEFMAVNDSFLRDEDNEFSDWVELYNAGPGAVNLGGWYLTDSAGNLTKWRFPATNLAANAYLVVFTSDKNRTNAGAPLHTNFRLDGAGEYLALVRPDGVTIAAEFSPYPDQFRNVSYGTAVQATSSNLLLSGTSGRYLVPGSDIGLGWTAPGYIDAAWLAGPTGVGYDTTTNYDAAIATDIEGPMRGVNASAYARVPFTVVDPLQFEELKLRLRYDDGFIAYLNGTEILRRNAPPAAVWNSAATGTHGPPPPGTLVENFDPPTVPRVNTQQAVAPGPTVMAAGAGSTGSFLRLIADGVNDNINSVAFNLTAPGLFQGITADFDFRVSNAAGADPADGFSFMLIPTSTYGTNGPGPQQGASPFEEPNFPGVFGIGFDLYPHATQNDVSVHWNGSEIINVTVPRGTLEFVSGTFHRCRVTLTHVTGGARVTVAITPNINGVPGAVQTPVNNIFVAGLNPFESRVEFGGRTGGLNMSVDLDNINILFDPGPALVPFEEFNISSALPLLQVGNNVLAIHGLNVTATNSDFLIEPQIVARDLIYQTNILNYFATPTPGGANESGVAEVAQTVQFSVPSGIYSNAVTVTLSASSSSAEIRYTLDGSEPNETSLLYSTPLTFNNSAVIRAKAYLVGALPSEVTSASYNILGTELIAFNSNLPIIVINSLGANIVQDLRIPASISVIETYQGRASFSLIPEYVGRIGTEIRGQSSTGFPKKSYNVEFHNEEDEDKAVSVLGHPAHADFALYAPYTDKSFMNDFLAFELHEMMGHYAVRRRYVEVFVDSTGGRLNYPQDYMGIYVFQEKIRIDPNRVDIANLNSGDTTEPDISGGYIFKKDKDSPGDVNFTTSSGQALKFHDPRGEDLTAAQRNWLVNYINQFEAALYGPNWRDPVLGYSQYIDVDSFADHMWIVEFAKQIDGYRLSNYMSKDRGGKIKMAPIWDWNLSFGNANYLNGGFTNGFYYPLVGAAEHIWLRRLVGDGAATPGDPDFVQKVIDRWAELREWVFNLNRVLGRIDQIAAQLNEAQVRDFAKWPRLGAYVWPNPDGANLVDVSIDGLTTIFDVNYATPGSYSNMIVQLKRWVTGHHTWLDNLYLKTPALSRTNGSAAFPLSVFAPTGTVYYTVNGSDPRLPGGAISPNAVAYSGPINLPGGARVVARAWLTNAWSGPVRGNFGSTVPPLAITEIMYHPDKPDWATNYSEEDFEFLELKNTTGAAIDLTGLRVAGGVDLVFPAGGLAPVASSSAQNFDGGGTPYTAATLANPPAASVQAGGPAGNYLRLLNSGSSNRNRIALDRTATGNYDRVVVDFDYRATTGTGGITSTGTATVANFDVAATPYTLTSHAGGNLATVLPANAGSSGSFLRLTPGATTESDSIVFDRTATGAFNTVVATFDFRATPVSGAADGLAFAFLRTATFGTTGAAPGFGGLSEEPNVANSVGVGFDIYANASTTVEPNDNHVSVHYNAQQGVAATPSFDISNARFHRAQVIIRFQNNNAFVTVRLTSDINGTPGATQTLFDNLQINGVAPYEGRVAFGARTGGAWAEQDIDNVNVQYFNINPAGGFTLALLPGSFPATGAGSSLANYVDEPNAANLLAVDFDVHEFAFINDVGVHYNSALRSGVSLNPAVLNLDNGQFQHARVEINRIADGSTVSVVLTPDIFGTPGAPIIVLSNAFVSGFSPANLRVELAGRSGGLDLAVDVDNVNAAYFANTPNLLAAGECAVVVRNVAAFQALYGMGIRILGQYAGQLDNGGENLQILGRLGELYLDFRYDDDWYDITDGRGFSLVLPNPNATADTWGLSTSWRRSGQPGGSPGVIDPAPAVIAPVLINEVLANSDLPEIDAIELFNPGTDPVDVGGWYLTDNFDQPKKYRLPTPSIIAGGAYLVVYETNFNATPGAPNNFGLRAEGDDVYVFSANGPGDLTGYFHGFDFGASDNNVSFGRHVTSEGKEHFVAQTAMTLGAANSGPLVGPVVIGEIMYHPRDYAGGEDNADLEYVELLNLSGQPVGLFDPLHPQNTWELKDAVDFDFPINTVLQPGGRLLVVNFDPVLDTVRRQAFLAAYGLSGTETILGPYGGKLQNTGDNVELARPGAPDPDTDETPEILVDKVDYNDQSPWPLAADGLGRSLVRVNPGQYGNDPANWAAGVPTPSAAPGAALPPGIAVQPVSQSVFAFNNVSFSVTAGGMGPFSYQWRFNGGLLPGATNSTLALNAVQFAQAGDYQVVVLNLSGSVDSGVATLTLNSAATILAQPQSRSVTLNATTNFTVSARGNGPIRYQWWFNGNPLNNATNAVLTITSAQATNIGTYQVVITDAVGAVASQPATLTVMIEPTIVVHPVSMGVPYGGTVTLSVQATNTATLPITNRWRRNSSGFLTNVLYSHVGFITLTNVTSSNRYDVILFNQARPAGLLSSGAVVTNVPDADLDGIADSWELTYGFSTNDMNDANADTDGDTMTNREEFIAGTNPLDPLSYLKVAKITPDGSAVIQFNAVSNRTYSVLFSDVVPAVFWTNLMNIPARTNSRPETVVDPSPGAARFYKLVTPAGQ